ncbi:hypothetical protein DRO69_06620 [Candidatus Bathyarchaeota archaeon]|nr:MAG: hypothetical protein DRO69_06620 [Candidatus Bathyarchaeota archaeon]
MIRGLTLIYGFKRFFRSWKLFLALLLGVVLASTFFAGINIGADTAAKQALDQRLSQIPVDIVVRSDYSYGELALLSSTSATEVASDVSGLEGVIGTEIISRTSESIQPPDSNDTVYISWYFRLVGISNESRVHDGLTVTDGNSTLQENEAYLWVGSENAEDFKIGDVLQFNFSIWDPRVQTETFLPLNVTVTGFVQLDDQARSIVEGDYYYYGGPGPMVMSQQYVYGGNLLILSWEETFAGLLDTVYDLSPSYSPIDTQILVYIDRGSLISPWDISGSQGRLSALTLQIDNKVSAYGMTATNNLQYALNMYQGMSMMMRFAFIVVALPVFFVAWYMGMTVSDVSFNLRRREIGLLLTKGFSKGQLFRIFLSETFLVGLIAGVVGIALSLLLNPFFIQAVGGQFGGTPVVGPDTVVITVVFSVAITLLSTFRSARRASKLEAVDALRQYMYVEEVKPYKRTWPWVAFLLGSYKMVILLLGINMATVMMRYRGGNILVMILLAIATILDGVLTYIGPLLFFWGFTKIFIRGSLKFQQLTTKAARFLGDLGALATRNVQRNPARLASIAFLIALIIGYSFQVVGILASEQDFITRDAYYNVGADIGVSLSSTTNASAIMSNVTNLPGVSSATLEYLFEGRGSGGYVSLRAIDPEAWLATAYYESEWFTGSDVEDAFHSLALDNDTIILQLSMARLLDLNIGDMISVTFGESVKELKVVGFFGRDLLEGTVVVQPFGYSYIGGFTDWSYVPEGLYHELSNDVSYASAKILVKLESGADGKAVADQIWELDSTNVSWVYSVEDELETRRSDPLSTGIANIQRLGIAFAILAASVGTALVALVSLKERSREASLMSVRGLSYKQLIIMLLTENLAIVTFAVLLGAFVGLIIVRGSVAATNAVSPSIVAHRMVFPMDSLLLLVSCIFLIFASTIIPVIVMARRYVSKLERMVRIG